MLHESILETHTHFIFTDFSNRKKDHKKSLVHIHTHYKYKPLHKKNMSEERWDAPTG